MWRIQLAKLNFDNRERNAVAAVLDSGWIAMGERVMKFESQFADFVGESVYASATSSGTAALHLALLAQNVTYGDEVIIPALTFVADANVARLVGAKPVLADSDSLDNWNVTPESIKDKVSSKTKAVIVVHFAGYPCDMPAIREFCSREGIFLIEDVAHAPGASVGGASCGSWGDIGCFSFFSNKNLSTGEGGMATTRDPELHQKLQFLRSHGMTSLTLDRHKGRAVSYDVAKPGLNYRMDEIRAALGLVQLDKLPTGNQRRKELTHRYRRNLAGSDVSIPFSIMPADATSAYHILPVLLPERCNRITVIENLKSKGIQSSIHYPAFWDFSGYDGCFEAQDAPIAAEICKRELTLPLFPTMTLDEVDVVTASLIEGLE
jgi:dTDP-4-amino-4,6-dideoxygalactose transaminase